MTRTSGRSKSTSKSKSPTAASTNDVPSDSPGPNLAGTALASSTLSQETNTPVQATASMNTTLTKKAKVNSKAQSSAPNGSVPLDHNSVAALLSKLEEQQGKYLFQ